MPPDKHQDMKPRTKSTDNVRVVEMRKERSRNAARSRRGKENAQFDELAKLLPLPAAITSQLDKASIIRLTISYLSMKEFSGLVPKRLQLTDGSEVALPSAENNKDMLQASSSMHTTSNEIVTFKKLSTSAGIPKSMIEETGQQLLQALDGFLMVLSMEGKILYVSETVSINLGLSQVELTGNNVFNYVHIEDHPDFLEQLASAASSDETVEDHSPGFFQCQNNQHGNNSLFNQGEEIGPPKLLPNQPRSFFVRMKCTLVRRGGSYAKSAGFKVVHCVGRVKNYASADSHEAARKALVVLAQPVPTMNINELPLECNMFVSRVNMDLKIVYCEGRIHRFMDYLAKDIVGISAYDFYHAGDVAIIQVHHAKFLAKGQVWTKYYRWMNKNGGWVWMQTKASLIPHPSNPGLKQMLCLNYILSDVEHRSVVLGMAQLKDKPELTSASNILTEVPCEADTTGELNDALIDDQVMVFPKWQATSDKLVPPQTVLDQMALQRTGYPAQFNDAFKDWSKQHQWSERTASQSESTEPEIDDKDLQDIADIISADITPFDHSLLDFVVSGKTPSSIADIPSSHLGPIGAYIEEIPTSSTTTVSTSSVIPKVESSSLQNEFGSTMSCSQSGRNAQRKRPAANGYPGVGSTADSAIPSKTPRLSHMQAMAANSASVGSPKMNNQSGSSSTITTPFQDNTNTWNPSTAPQMGRYAGSGQNISITTSTVTKAGSNFYPGMAQTMGGGVSNGARSTASSSQSKAKGLASRKPKTLLEQLVMMPNSGNDDELLTDDLMLELVEELLDKSGDDEMMGDVQEFGSAFGSRDTNYFVPCPQIKQEVVTPTSAEPPVSFPECFQNKSSNEQQRFATSYRENQSNEYQTDAQRRSAVVNQSNVFSDRSSTNLRSTMQPQQQQQQQWPQQQTQQLQHSWQRQQQVQQQQRQQNRQSLQQYQQRVAKNQGSVQQQTTPLAFPQQQNLQSLPQKQQPLPQYNYQLQPQQQQQQQQQQKQQTPAQQMLSEHEIIREISDLIQKNNNMSASQNFANQQTLRISSAPLPELGNVLDEELNVNQHPNTINNQNYNGTVAGTGERVDQNFTGMM